MIVAVAPTKKTVHVIVLQHNNGCADVFEKTITDWDLVSPFSAYPCVPTTSLSTYVLPSARRFMPLQLRPQKKPCRCCGTDAGEIATCTGVVATNRSDVDWTTGSCGPVRRKLLHSLSAHNDTVAFGGCVNVCSIEHTTIMFVFM